MLRTKVSFLFFGRYCLIFATLSPWLCGCGDSTGTGTQGEQATRPAGSPAIPSNEIDQTTSTEQTPRDRTTASVSSALKDPRMYDYRFRQARRESEPLPAAEPVTMDEYRSTWQVTTRFDGRPAGEVIREVAEQCGFELFEPETFADALATPISLDLEDVSRLQVLEEACRQAGLYPKYDLRLLGFKAGPRPYPIQFSGPFAFLVEDVRENATHGAASLRLQLVAASIPTCVLARLTKIVRSKGDNGPFVGFSNFAVGSVTGTDGTQLLAGPKPVPSATWYTHLVNSRYVMTAPFNVRACGDHLVAFRNAELSDLTQSVTQIERIDGELTFIVPTEVQTLTFDDLQSGAEQSHGDTRLKLGYARVATKPGQPSTIQVNYSGARSRMLSFVAVDANGKRLVCEENGEPLYQLRETHGQRQPRISGGIPKKLIAKVISNFASQSLPFTLGPVQLKDSKSFPRVLPELASADAPPVSVVLKSITPAQGNAWGELNVAITNESQIPIQRLYVQTTYLDKDQKTLGGDVSLSFITGGQLLKPGESRDFSTHALGANDHPVEDAHLKIRAVVFADNRQWLDPNAPREFTERPPADSRRVQRESKSSTDASAEDVPPPKRNMTERPSLADQTTGQNTTVTDTDSLPEIDRPNAQGFSQLHRAAMSGNTDAAAELIKRGANVNVPQEAYKGTPLQYAAARGKLDVLKLLIKSEAKIDSLDSLGRTPLMWAAQEDQPEAVAALLDAGADALHSGRRAAVDRITQSASESVQKAFEDFFRKQPRPDWLRWRVERLVFTSELNSQTVRLWNEVKPPLVYPKAAAGDDQRGRLDLWTANQIPFAVSSYHIRKNGKLVRSLALLRESPVKVVADGTTVWQPASKDFPWKPVPKAEPPTNKSDERLKQMTAIARRFSMAGRTLQPSPIQRYAADLQKEAVADAGVFAFIKDDAPNAILVLEARGSGKDARWHYTLVRFTAPPASVQLDGNTVFQWTGFWVKPRQPGADFVEQPVAQ